LISVIGVFGQTNSKHVKVKGYYKKDGAYVQPHYRTAPNSTNIDNFSTKPNVNPYTGKKGYIEPDNNYLPSTNNYNYTSQKTEIPSLNYSNPTTTSPSINYSSSSIDYEEIKKEQEKWMKEEYPKIQEEQERWMKEEYPKIQAEQNRFLKKYNSTLSTTNNYLENSTSVAIKYHHRYSLEDRKIVELALQKLGYYIGTADGYFDTKTISGIKSFQRNTNLNVDGKVGPSTLNRLSKQFE
jgi:murein L,D-transpeptidase YcbB/YkuD